MRKRADQLLVERGLFESRARAQAAIAAGLVLADGVVVRKASEAIAQGAEIEASAPHPYVSRGGVKLAHALDTFGIDPAGRTALDLGASTGGFCDVLLRRGASRVFAVDVGRGQLHASLLGDPRLVNLEGTDARNLTAGMLSPAPDLVTGDVSFISLRLVLPPALALAAPAARLVVLVKPQFEAGRDHVGRGGVVKDPAVHEAVCAGIGEHVTSLGWRVRAIVPSPIEGGDGNREFLLFAERER